MKWVYFLDFNAINNFLSFFINQFNFLFMISNSLTEPLSISLPQFLTTLREQKRKTSLLKNIFATMKNNFVDYYDHFCWKFFSWMFKIFDRYILLWSPIKLIIQWSQIIQQHLGSVHYLRNWSSSNDNY